MLTSYNGLSCLALIIIKKKKKINSTRVCCGSVNRMDYLPLILKAVDNKKATSLHEIRKSIFD